MYVRIIDTDSPRIAELLNAGSQQAADFSVPLTEVGMDVIKVEEAVFHSEGRRGGGSWAHLKDDTVRKKGNTQILRTEGANPGYSALGDDALYRSVTKLGAPGQIFRVTPHTLDFGTDLPEAEFAQFGSKKQRPRPFLKFTQYDNRRWMNILMNHLVAPFSSR